MESLLDFISNTYYRWFGSARLRSYEGIALDAWASGLSPEAKAILDQQLGSYDLVLRYSADKLVCFYCVGDPGCRRWPADRLFPFRSEQTIVAVVPVRAADGRGEAVTADLLLSNGRFATIQFDSPPRATLPGPRLRGPFMVESVTVCLDPTDADAHATTLLPGIESLYGWPRQWAEQLGAVGLRRPLPPATRARIIEALNVALPSDYLDVVSQTEGLTVGRCRIHGLAQVHTVVLPEANLRILADVEGGGALGVAARDSTGVLQYYDSETAEVRPVGGSLRTAVARILEMVPDEQP